ncbi:MAG: glycoside hydrolase, partial [Halobacteriales archaeon]|nr:glycoside hydrolase [Halobacteriales archaeon]
YADRQPGDPTYGYACNTDHMFQFTKDGALHYGVEMYNLLGSDADNGPVPVPGNLPLPIGGLTQVGWEILLATSTDGGDTWPTVITYAPQTGTLTDDYSRMAVSPTTQTILEGINLIAGTGVFCNMLASHDGGQSADPPVEVAVLTTDPATSATYACRGLAAAPDGTFVIAFRGPGEGIGNAPEMWFTHSKDDGRTWSPAAHGFDIAPVPFNFTENQFRTGTDFEMAFAMDGPAKGTLYAVYGENHTGNADVMLRASRDQGATWGEPVRVSDDASGHDQWMPNLAVARDGSIHVFYMDKRWDPANKLIDLTHAVSVDQGARWADERLTNVSFDGDLGKHQSGFPFFGDYIGAASAGDEVWAGYPDASDGKATVTAAAHVRKG